MEGSALFRILWTSYNSALARHFKVLPSQRMTYPDICKIKWNLYSPLARYIFKLYCWPRIFQNMRITFVISKGTISFLMLIPTSLKVVFFYNPYLFSFFFYYCVSAYTHILKGVLVAIFLYTTYFPAIFLYTSCMSKWANE